jgi:glucokinase
VLKDAKLRDAPTISGAAIDGSDPLAAEAVDMFLAIVGAEAGAMALRVLAKGGVYIAGGITPKLISHIAALHEGYLMRKGRPMFSQILKDIPLYVILNENVGQIGAREVAAALAADSFHASDAMDYFD